jgi:twitching motility two-component system response regulator PilH
LARKILLADDSVTAQNMGRKILTDAGYEVVAVNNGSAALKKIVELKPDLIVLDVYMPGYSGLEVCQRIKENRETARIPVLLTVGKLEPFKPEEARRARADAFVVKPFEASELISAIAKLEEKIGPQPEPYKPGRFAKAVASLDENESPSANDRFGDSDSGWKSRLRFPGRKKQVEPEEAPEVPAPAKSLRELREEAAPLPKTHSPVAPEFERPIPSGIPRDITPEEIAAISAAAARLSGASAPEVEEPSKPQEPAPSPVLDSTQPASQAVEPSELPHPSPESVVGNGGNAGTEEAAPVTFATAPALAEDKVVEDKPVEAQALPLPSVPGPQTKFSMEPELVISSPAQDAVASIEQPIGAISEGPIVTSDTEPVGNSVPESAQSSVEQAAEISAETLTAASDVAPSIAKDGPLAPGEAAVPIEPKAEVQSTAQIETSQDIRTEVQSEPASPVVDSAPVPVAETAAVMPAQDEEVMAALQNLIPAGGSTNGDAPAAYESDASSNLVAAVAEFAPGGIPVGRPRWIAEEAVLTAEEAALSLEQEMEKAYAAFAATEAARMLATSAIESLTSTQAPFAATALVEVPVAIVDPHHAADFAPSDAIGESIPALENPTVIGSSAIEIPSVPEIAATAVAESGSPSIDTAPSISVSETPSEPSAPRRPSVTDFVVAASPIPDRITDPLPVDSQCAAQTSEPIAATAGDQPTLSVGDEDSMAKNSETGFKMIRQTPAGSKAASSAPVTKENFDGPAKAAEPAAMAAAAAADATSSAPPMPASAPDPRAIASIVDSVLAELRPKIVEEIAKKLSESK